MNKKYSEYVYTAMGETPNLDATSRYIWVWYEKMFIDDTGHIRAAAQQQTHSPGKNQLLVQLQGIKYNVTYYMRSGDKMIAGWESQQSSGPVNSIWNIEFIDNERIVLYQGDYIMCSTEEKYNTERRTVRAYKRGTYNFESDECQWLLGKCDRR
ncbi:uncharacterized protein [Musca autumnalis]|uniref:uncharacterized protein n=1 Tax=Musca autumnalis TaxID=221902 RepID=UPI003CF974FB